MNCRTAVGILGVACAAACTNNATTLQEFDAPGSKDAAKTYCVGVVAGFDLGSPACSDCLHAKCAAPHQAALTACADDALVSCNADTVDAEGFCRCAVQLPDGCGNAMGVVYACFDQLCADSCAGGGVAGTGGEAGTGGTGGTGGVGGYGGGYGGSGNYAGDGGPGGYGGYGGGGTGAYGGGGYGGYGGAPTCALQTQDPVCDPCINGKCFAECDACVTSSDCIAILQCLGSCTDMGCYDTCYAQYPSGFPAFDAFLGNSGCLTVNCAADCGG